MIEFFKPFYPNVIEFSIFRRISFSNAYLNKIRELTTGLKGRKRFTGTLFYCKILLKTFLL